MIMVLYENVLIDTMQIMERFVIICDFVCQYSAQSTLYHICFIRYYFNYYFLLTDCDIAFANTKNRVKET